MCLPAAGSSTLARVASGGYDKPETGGGEHGCPEPRTAA